MFIELWIVIGLIGSILNGVFNIQQKYLMDGNRRPLELVVGMHVVAVILLSPLLLIFGSYMTVELAGYLVLTGITNGLSFWYLADAYEHGALSLIAPLRGVTPILVAFMEPLLFSSLSYRAPLVIAGLTVGAGVYILLYEDDIMQPILRLKDVGVRRGVLSAVLISFAVLIDRFALVETAVEPESYAMYVGTSALMMSFLIVQLKSEKSIREMVVPDKGVALLGVVRAGLLVLVFSALSLTEGTRVNVVWQLGLLLSVVVGGKIMQEDDLLRRSVGASMVIVAAAIVVLL